MVLPDPDDARWWADPVVPSSYVPPSTPAPVEPSADERREQLERFRRQRALEARLAAGEAERQPLRARGAWGTADAADADFAASPADTPRRRRPTVLRLISLAVVTALLGSGVAIIVAMVMSGTNPLERLPWADDAAQQAIPPEAIAPEIPQAPADGWGVDTPEGSDDDVIVEQVDPGEVPADEPGPTVEPTPLGTPPPMPSAPGNYRFIALQAASDQPVTYDPCRPIRYQLNNADAPVGANDLVAEALAEVSAATGLVFEFVGMTDELPTAGGEIVRDDAGAWPPVIVGWTNPDVEPRLGGNVAGLGGSVELQVTTTSPSGETVDQTAVFVTGSVTLDGPQLGEIIARSPDGRAAALAVIKHEVAHLVGLDHVDDPGEIMNPEGSAGVTRFGPGDLRGLNHLGRGPCIPEA